MDRGNAKHGPHLDDQLKGEHSKHGITELGDDEPVVGFAPDERHAGSAPAGMTTVDVTRRAELAAGLPPGAFPADAAALRDVASAEDSLDWIREDLERLPGDRIFRNVGEVWEALGNPKESQRF
jgi:hypothetical protein